MKKTYITPAMTEQSLDTQCIIALSLKQTPASSSDALVKGNEWDIWGDDIDEEDL